MILVDHMIRAELEKGTLKVTPFDDNLINPSSLDVRLGNKFGKVLSTYLSVNPMDHTSFKTEDFEVDTSTLIFPGEFLIAHLMEDITLPRDISAKVNGKSSLGRLGLENSSCAGWVDPGWAGKLTIELFNYSKNRIVLTPGMKIGQIIFYKHPPCEVSYGEKPTSKYMNQTPGQGSKGI